MSRFIGEERLKTLAGNGEPRGIHKITERVYFIAGYGTSNAVLVEGEQSCFLVDALEDSLMAELALKDIRKITNKPIAYLIYTHCQHPDHIGGAGVLAENASEILARRSSGKIFGDSELINGIGMLRGARQFGFKLTPEEAISMGAGPLGERGGKMMPLPPSHFFEKERMTLNIDGIDVVVVAAPGETDDQTYVWLPKEKVLCCGDNYYKSWPNLSPIRGNQYRDIYTWIQSLDELLAFDAQYLLPGHTQAIIGQEAIKEQVGAYRDGIKYVLEETLKGMNAGLSPDQLVEQIKLPAQLQGLPQLEELYGTIAWSVRGIYAGYLGWFDGNPTHLGSLPVKVRAEKTLVAMGGAERVLAEATAAMDQADEQWGMELCDILLEAEQKVPEAKVQKARGMINLGRMATNATARHYYLTCAQELQA